MELDDMKLAWTEMSAKMEQQKKLTDQLIMDMTKVKYNSLLNRVFIPETIGTFVCFIFIGVLIYYFDRFNTPFLATCAIVTIGLFIILPLLSLWSIAELRPTDISKSNSKDVMAKYLRGRKRFVAIQKFNLVMGGLLLVTCAPLSLVFMSNPNKLANPFVLTWLAFVGLAFLYFFGRPVYKYYVRSIEKIEDVLKELE